MTRDDVIRMAREADIKLPDGPFPALGSFALPDLIQFARLVYEKAWADTALAATHTVTDAAILKEREACAKDAEWCIQNHLEHLMPERIRARSNP